MGRKYIIELEERPFYSSDPMVVGTELMAERLYRVKGFKSLVFDEEGLKRLTPYEEAETKLQINYDFPRCLRYAIEKNGMSQRDLAAKIGVTEVNMSRYLSGNRTPKAPVIAQMAATLGVSTDYLLGIEEAP